jgi:uncharacterized DUF497 family protein
LAVTLEDSASVGERRFVTVGADHLGRLLVVIHAPGAGEMDTALVPMTMHTAPPSP